jgi:excisionase family DNA binding protein
VDDPLGGYLTLLEAAQVLGIHPDSLRKLAVANRIPGSRKWRGRQWLFERATLQQFAQTYRGARGRPPRGLFDTLW